MNKLVEQGNFLVNSLSFPLIGERVVDLNWSSSRNELIMTLSEHEDFETIKWINAVIADSKIINKSPFVEIPEKSIIVTFNDKEGKPLATLSLMQISVKDHWCFFGSQATMQLNHKVVLEYQKMIFDSMKPEIDPHHDWQKEKNGQDS